MKSLMNPATLLSLIALFSASAFAENCTVTIGSEISPEAIQTLRSKGYEPVYCGGSFTLSYNGPHDWYGNNPENWQVTGQITEYRMEKYVDNNQPAVLITEVSGSAHFPFMSDDDHVLSTKSKSYKRAVKNLQNALPFCH
jgi:hypothetical protein